MISTFFYLHLDFPAILQSKLTHKLTVKYLIPNILKALKRFKSVESWLGKKRIVF